MFGEGFPTIWSCNISGVIQLPGIFYACSSSCKAPQDSYLESHSESEFPASGPSRGEKRCESFDIYRCGLPMHKSNLIPKVMVVVLVAQSSPTLCNPMDHARILCPWDFPGKNTGVSCHFLLQGIFLTQGSNSCLLHWQADSLPLSHQGSPEGGVGGAGGTKITARESEQPLWLSGQWRGWLKAAMPKGSVRDRITCQGPLPASKSWVYWGGFLEISQHVQRQCHCREAVVLLGECSGGQVTHKLKGPERSSQRGQILPGLWIWITPESQSVLQTLTRL